MNASWKPPKSYETDAAPALWFPGMNVWTVKLYVSEEPELMTGYCMLRTPEEVVSKLSGSATAVTLMIGSEPMFVTTTVMVSFMPR